MSIFMKADSRAFQALMDGAAPIDAYRMGYPLANHWRDETVAQKAAVLFTPERVVEFKNLVDEMSKAKAPTKAEIDDPDNPAPLPPNMENFCHEFVIDLAAKQAAIRAGYSPRSAKTLASQMLAQPRVQRRIAELKREQFRRMAVSADDIVAELVKVGFRDVRNLFSEDGSTLLGPRQMDDMLASAVDTIEVSVRPSINEDGEKEVVHIHKVKFGDKLRALESIGKHLGMFADKLQLTGASGGPIETITQAMTPEQAAEIYKRDMNNT